MLNTEQEAVRQNLIDYLDNTGTKACVISKRLDIPASVLSSFKNGKKSLNGDSLYMLKNYLQFAGFDTVACTVSINKTFLA